MANKVLFESVKNIYFLFPKLKTIENNQPLGEGNTK